MMKEYLIVFCNHSRSYNIIYIFMKKLLLSSLIVTSIAAFATGYIWEIDYDAAEYLADLGIITKQTNPERYRTGATITRAEVVGIALKIK